MSVNFEPNDALLIVDAQNDFFPNGSLGVPNGDQIIPILNELIQDAQQKNIPIIASRDWHPKDHCSFEAQGGPWPAHCIQETKGAAFHPEVKLPASAIVVNKAFDRTHESYSALEGMTDQDHKTLTDLLQELGIKRLWIGGLALDYCVKHSVLDAAKAGLEANVILEATKAIDTDAQQTVIDELTAAGATIV